jgi:glycosyltransferase involved in cell wall biosynthesis
MTDFCPKVSIIIPVYNGANYLHEALNSALAQTYTNTEIIVINDGSKDNTEDIALSYGDKIRYFSKENGGQSSALNYGIEKMTGEYFSWLSHDDKYTSAKLEEQILVLSKLENKSTIIYSSSISINPNGDKIKDDYIIGRGLIHPAYLLLRYNSFNGNTVLIKKDLFNLIGCFNIAHPHTSDVELFFKLANEYPFYYIDKCLIYSRVHKAQATFRKFKYHNYESNIFLIEAISSLTNNRLCEISETANVYSVLREIALNWSKRGYKLAYKLVLYRLRVTTSVNYYHYMYIRFKCYLNYIINNLKKQISVLIFKF